MADLSIYQLEKECYSQAATELFLNLSSLVSPLHITEMALGSESLNDLFTADSGALFLFCQTTVQPSLQ